MKLFTLILGIFILNAPTASAIVFNNDVNKRYDNNHSVSSNSYLAGKYGLDGRNPPPPSPGRSGTSR